jgi:hypothetical protein
MSGPWYETTGPNAEYVRKDVLYYIIKVGNVEFEKQKIIPDVILKIIPDSRNDFGSFRCYSSFNVKRELAEEVIKEVKIRYAYLIIEKKFIPFVTHQLYKPGGIMAKKVAKETMVGKECNHGYWYNNQGYV